MVTVACDIGLAPELKTIKKKVGIDLGISSLITLSTGKKIRNPRWAKRLSSDLDWANRSFSKKMVGGRNREKALAILRKVHRRIWGRRRNYFYGVSEELIRNYDLIACEKLNIQWMVRGERAKSVVDSAWGELIRILTYKAEEAGVWLIPVNPKDTTQLCSGCRERVPKDITQRWHECQKCGLSLSRDHNAALNILRLGESLADIKAKRGKADAT